MSSLADNVLAARAENKPLRGENMSRCCLIPFFMMRFNTKWVKELLEGNELTKKEKESKLADKFDIFTSKKGEMINSYYIRFAKLISDINIIGLEMTPLQVNTKFVNHLQPEWSRGTRNTRIVRIVGDLNAIPPKVIRCYNYKEKVDAYDLEVYDAPITNAIFMAKLSPVGPINRDEVGPSYDLDILSELEPGTFTSILMFPAFKTVNNNAVGRIWLCRSSRFGWINLQIRKD
nr:integrase, catalytic region, zinc finger, CCHC-type, peptidase aspartic, catalytic [Tanacetum cinerariifolium]